MKLTLVMWIALVPMFASAQTPVCTTHFDNQSNFTWMIQNFDGNRRSLSIPPHSRVPINWGDTTVITIRGGSPSQPYANQFVVKAANGCVQIVSPGPASALSVNSPNPGDVTTCAGGC